MKKKKNNDRMNLSMRFVWLTIEPLVSFSFSHNCRRCGRLLKKPSNKNSIFPLARFLTPLPKKIPYFFCIFFSVLDQQAGDVVRKGKKRGCELGRQIRAGSVVPVIGAEVDNEALGRSIARKIERRWRRVIPEARGFKF
jgi:hypothetical protein